MAKAAQPLWKLLGVLFKPHPWHGISPGDKAPSLLQCFVEVVPSDTLKYEIDKVSGYLRIDRPQKYSNICPALYGFVPQTYCGDSVAAFSSEKTGRTLAGDGDPLDILVLMDSPAHVGCLIEVRIIGVIIADQTDGAKKETNDRLLGVAVHSYQHDHVNSMDDLSKTLLSQLEQFFVSYNKQRGKKFKITGTGGPKKAISFLKKGIRAHKKGKH